MPGIGMVGHVQAEQRLLKLCFDREHNNEDARTERMLIFLLDVNQTKYVPKGRRGAASGSQPSAVPCRIHKGFLGHHLCHVCRADASGVHYRKEVTVRAHLKELLRKCEVCPCPSRVGVTDAPAEHVPCHNTCVCARDCLCLAWLALDDFSSHAVRQRRSPSCDVYVLLSPLVDLPIPWSDTPVGIVRHIHHSSRMGLLQSLDPDVHVVLELDR